MESVRVGDDSLADCLRHILGHFCRLDVVLLSSDGVRQQ
jgi:hypothetical protein